MTERADGHRGESRKGIGRQVTVFLRKQGHREQLGLGATCNFQSDFRASRATHNEDGLGFTFDGRIENSQNVAVITTSGKKQDIHVPQI